MTTSPTMSDSSPTLAERAPLRLRLDNSFQSGQLDGAWWPQSRDLQREAADLVDHFPALIGRIARLLFSRPDWDTVPGDPSIRRVQATRGTVKMGSFPSDDTHVVVLKMSSGERLRLLVVPADTEPNLASLAMQQAADDRNTQGASTLLGLPGPDQSEIGHAAWNDDAAGIPP